MQKKYHIRGDNLIIESDPSIGIPIAKILLVSAENDNAGPCVKITTVSGTIVRFWIDSSQKQKILNMVQNKRAEVLSRKFSRK